MDSICEAEIIFVYAYLGSNESWDLMLAVNISESDRRRLHCDFAGTRVDARNESSNGGVNPQINETRPHLCQQ